MYFVGNFDGKRFTPDRYPYPLWQEQGMDNYASVTWSNTGDRRVCIGWMNNQLYSGNYPCKPWRSAMTLPRELSLVEYDGKPLLRSTIVKEIDVLGGEWRTANHALNVKDAYQLNVPVTLDKDCVIRLSNDAGNVYEVTVEAATRRVIIDRGSRAGAYTSREFPLTCITGDLNTDASSVVFQFYVDQSSVEICTEDGSLMMATLVFPSSIYDRLSVEGQNPEAKVRDFERIW